jgi:exonuclease SbcC
MRPRRLDLLNFACYEGEVAIPFDDLEHDLFAIAGPTGSGKSTILDAMTWALYGRTHRLGSQGLNETLMSPGATHLASTLEFTSRGETYRVTRSVRRLPSGYKPDIKIERLRPDSSWATLPETEKIREANQRIESIVGLDYDSFTRAALLPQGDFAEFLAGDAPKRREVVARLYGGDTVERMRAAASETSRSNKARVESVTARLEGDLKDATAANVTAASDQLEGLQRHAAETQELASSLEQRIVEYRETTAAFERLEAAKRNLSTLETIDRSDERESLARADAAERLRHTLHALQQSRSRHTTSEADLRTATVRAEASRKISERSAGDLELTKQARDATHQKADATKRHIRTAERHAALLRRTGGRLTDRQRHDGTPVDEEATQKLHDALLRVPALLSLDREARALKARLDATTRRASDIQADLVATKAGLGDLKKDGKRLRGMSERAAATHAAAVEQHAVDQIRDHLHEGDNCPVCQQRVLDVPSITGGANQIDELKEVADDANASLNDALSNYMSLQQHQLRLKKESERLAAEVVEQRQALTDAQDAYRDAARHMPIMDGAKPQTVQSDLEKQLRALHATLAHNVHSVVGDDLPGDALKAIQAHLRQADQQLADAARLHHESQNAVAQHEAALDASKGTHGVTRDALATAQQATMAALATSPFDTPEEAAASLMAPEEAQALRNALAQHEAARQQATDAVTSATITMGGREYNPEALPQATSDLAATRSAVLAATESIGSCKMRLETLQWHHREATALREERAQHQVAFETHATLERSLRASAFQAFLLIHAQRELAKQASETIRAITDGRYELTFHDDSFYVRDTWQDTQERSVRTLSGGETFVVSLALALALSDSIAGRHTLGALFLDEGFGSLDAETLNNVAEVLASLTSTGRMVGIISHVSSLTELMPQRLLVSKSESGSRAHWEL